MISSLPAALAIAASPFAIIPAIMLLLTARPRASAGGFLGAWFLGVTAATGASVALVDATEEYSSSPTWMSWLRIALAMVLVVLATRTFAGRKGPAKQPAWMAAISTATPRRAAGLGCALSLANPKVLALAVAGGVAIGAQDIAVSREAVHVLLFASVASISVALPWFAFLVAGERALPVLETMRDWLERHAATMTAIILVVIALVLASGGVAELTRP